MGGSASARERDGIRRPGKHVSEVPAILSGRRGRRLAPAEIWRPRMSEAFVLVLFPPSCPQCVGLASLPRRRLELYLNRVVFQLRSIPLPHFRATLATSLN